jgi:hypothetical protein
LVACPVPPTDAGDSIERTISGLVGGLQQSCYGRSLSALIGSGAVDRDGIEWNELAEGNIDAAGLTDLKPLPGLFLFADARGTYLKFPAKQVSSCDCVDGAHSPRAVLSRTRAGVVPNRDYSPP